MPEETLSLFDPPVKAVEYRDVPGHPGYRAGDDGSAWSCWSMGSRSRMTDSWHKLTPNESDAGYLRITMKKGGQRLLHRVVLASFVGQCPEGMEGCHNDGDSLNNRLENLRWDTQEANEADRILHGKMLEGERHPNRKLTSGTVRQIRRMYASGEYMQKELAEMFSVTSTNVSVVVRGETWKRSPIIPYRKHMHNGSTGEKNGSARLTEENVLDIRKRHASGEPLHSIAKYYKYSMGSMCLIIQRKRWKHI